MTEKKDIREHLIEELKKDLVGPRGEEEVFVKSEGDIPTSRYLSGVLYPRQTRMDENLHLKSDNEEPEDESENVNQDANPFSATIGTHPSSCGMDCCLSKETKIIQVDVSFGLYEKEDTERKLKGGKIIPDEKWKRKPIKVPTFTIKTDESDDKDLENDIRITWRVRERGNRRYISIYLLNKKENSGKDIPTQSNECIFQPEIILSASETSKALGETKIFLPMAGFEESKIEQGIEDLQYDLLFRKKVFFAVGRNCSVEWSKQDELTDKVEWVKTSFVPRYEIEIIEPKQAKSEPLSTNLRLKTLKDVKDFSEYEKLLLPIVSEYETWLEKIEKSTTVPKKYEGVDKLQIQNCHLAKKRIIAGIKLISTDSIAGQAFQFANEAMWDQMMYSRWAKENMKNGMKGVDSKPPFAEYEENNPPMWYIFQIAFILLNLESTFHPESNDREIVDLLWFPTGGGKTEAYLGIVAFVLGMKRLREGEDDGVTVLMRYTYRLLTIQQFHRASALMCSCEYIRQHDVEKWGKEPFRVGLFVGDNTTPNNLQVARKNLYSKSEDGSPVQILNCPRCGQHLVPQNYKIVYNPLRMAIKCGNENCYYGTPDNDQSYLPVVFVDDDIIRTLPSLIIGTVDKFARLAWEAKFAALFGNVRQCCEKHGFHPGSAEPPPAGKSVAEDPMFMCSHTGSKESKNRIKEYEKPIPPPELIIQDELHLITGPMGTLVGLYETVVEDLCTINGIKPKIIASTATIKNSEDQIKWIFGRINSKIFPPQVFEFGDTYFSDIVRSNERVGRIHLGICSTSVGIQTIDARIAAVLLRKIRYILDNKHNEFDYTKDEIDPYYSLISYYNTVRHASSAMRYYESDVKSFMGVISTHFEKDGNKIEDDLDVRELTGRLPSKEIPDVIQQLDIGLTNEERPLDVLVCTNMLSVGVDIQRLSLMLINNQPKHTSEYIQASGRIGRRKNSPGLVVTSYRYSGARDLSIYENFIDFHSTYHKNVEPGTLTPFASRALETGLFGVIVAFVRNYGRHSEKTASLARKKGAGMFNQTNPKLLELLEKVKMKLEARVKIVDNKETIATMKFFENFKNDWFKDAEELKDRLYYKRTYWEGSQRAPKNVRFLLKTVGDVDEPDFQGRQIPNSMRQADGDVKVYYSRPRDDQSNE